MRSRGMRGATTVSDNAKAEIVAATKELLLKLIEENSVAVTEITAAFFSLTADLNAEFPAVAARELGWQDVPLLCMRELDVPGSLPCCIRVMLLVNTDKTQTEIKHIYLKEAVKLRR